MKPLFDFDDKKLRLYTASSMAISGLKNFCSGAMMSGWSGGVGIGFADVVMNEPKPKEFKACGTFAEYKAHYGTSGCYAVPEEYAYLFFLEALYNKAHDGEGGANDAPYQMWAGNRWATKTWFIADRMTGRDWGQGSLSCASFMTFFSQPGTGWTYGRMVLSGLADGAHGGQCAGGAWAPNLPYIREKLDEALIELNDHAKYMAETYGVAKAGDAVANLY